MPGGAGGHPGAELPRPGHELEGREQVHGLAVDPRVDGGGGDLDGGGRPRPAPGPRPVAGRVEDDDPEPAAVERRARAGRTRRLQARRGCWRPGRPPGGRVPVPGRRRRAAPAPPRSGRAPPRPSPAACGPWRRGSRVLDRLAVDPERDVVEEQAPVDLGDVDPALDPVGEGVERADRVVCDRGRGRARSGSASRPGCRRRAARAPGRPWRRWRATRRHRRRPGRPRRRPPPGRPASPGPTRAEDDDLDPTCPRPLDEAARAPPGPLPTAG